MQEKTILALTFIRNIIGQLPGTEEKLCFDTPAFYANKHIFARLKEDEENLVIYTEERDRWMHKSPSVFTITPHYIKYKYMLVNLDAVVPEDLKELIITAWKLRTSKAMLKKFEEANNC